MGLLKAAENRDEINFEKVDLKKAYQMIKSPAMVATKGEKHYNLTPYGWIMPLDYEPLTRVIFSSDPEHQAVANIMRTKEFAVCMPLDAEDPFVHLCGTVSNPESDKYALFDIPAERADLVDVMIPKKKISGWIEFRLLRTVTEGSVILIMGEAVAAYQRSGM